MRCALAVAAILAATGASAETPGDYEKGFDSRARLILKARAAQDPVEMMNWAERIDLGDPHKYALGPIMARLHFDPSDAKALRAYRMLMEVDKQKRDRGLYHFAVYQRTRLYFQFRDILPKDILQSNRYDATNYFDIMTRGGTENHRFMHRASAYLWAEEVPAGPKKSDSKRASKKWLADWLRDQARKLYHVGMGEYDSSTYVCFSAASVANVYDFADDPEMRKVARATLDWMAAALARKYFHGCNLGPEARGFAKSAVATNTDWMSWLWWDDSGRKMGTMDPEKVGKHAVTNLCFSKYRPHPIIRKIARKEVELPYAARGSKPGYFGWNGNKDQEQLYFNDQYAMGTLYSPEKGVRTRGTILPQTTMFKVAVRGRDDVYTFGASNGYHRHYPIEGRTPYDQYHQARDAAINICCVDAAEDDRTKHRSILGVPKGWAPNSYRPAVHKGWYSWQYGNAYVAARPLNGKADWSDLGRSEEQLARDKHKWLVSPGKLTGWVVQLGQKSDRYRSQAGFQIAVASKCKLDLSQFQDQRTVTFTSLRGDVLKMRHTGGPGGRPEAWTNGEKLSYEDWPVFESPYVNEPAGQGVLRLSDGRRNLTIDFSGKTPKYRDSSEPASK